MRSHKIKENKGNKVSVSGSRKNNHKLKNSRKQDNYIHVVKQTEYKKGCACDTKGRGITPGRERGGRGRKRAGKERE